MKASIIFLWVCLVVATQAVCQSESRFSVKYMVSYDAGKQVYTAWVVPQYDTPNQYNGDSEEKGSTAQFTLRVPAGFVLSDLRDVRGSWEKSPLKIGGQSARARVGADGSFGIYTIGKAPVEISYGAFRTGEPVALFTFRGQGGDPQEVTALAPGDGLISQARKELSLNVGNSFYSRSGQAATVRAKPMEQFAGVTTTATVLAEMNQRLVEQMGKTESSELMADPGVIVYPNPVLDKFNVKYFSQAAGSGVVFSVLDLNGTMRQSQTPVLVSGFNTIEFSLDLYPGGTYLLRAVEGEKVITRKVLKNL